MTKCIDLFTLHINYFSGEAAMAVMWLSLREEKYYLFITMEALEQLERRGWFSNQRVRTCTLNLGWGFYIYLCWKTLGNW